MKSTTYLLSTLAMLLATASASAAAASSAAAATSASASANPNPVCRKYCPKIYRPVCGSDGVTYLNECLLSVAVCQSSERNLTKVKDGICRGVICTKEFSPVCGSNGQTFDNACEVIDFGLEVAYQGECTGSRRLRSEQGAACTTIYEPVCGSDGNTYGNRCMLENAARVTAGLQLAHAGEC